MTITDTVIAFHQPHQADKPYALTCGRIFDESVECHHTSFRRAPNGEYLSGQPLGLILYTEPGVRINHSGDSAMAAQRPGVEYAIICQYLSPDGHDDVRKFFSILENRHSDEAPLVKPLALRLGEVFEISE